MTTEAVTPEAVYPYVDEAGDLLFEVCRLPDKRFMQRRRNGSGHVWGLGETRRVLFRLPRLLEHIAAGACESLYIVEGEKDVLAIEAAGGVATCNPMGAGKWTDTYSEPLAGARHVVIVADRDEPGIRHAHAVRESLAQVGVVAEIAQAAEGKDAADHLAAGKTLEELIPIDTLKAEAELRIVTLDEFVEVDEPGASALVGGTDSAVIPEGGDIMFYGDGGAGKTTLCVDLAFHLAAADAWLGIPVARPLRVLIIENEGPRPLFRRKLKRKRDTWAGSPIADRVKVFEVPWGRFSFDDSVWRQRLAAQIRELDIDVVIAGPVTRSGMNEAGTLQEVRDFMALVDEVRTLSGRRIADVLVHHENKGGQVSGAWEAVGDTLFHVQAQGHGRMRLFFQKTRWSSEHHGTSLHLTWADGDGFALEDRPELDDDTLAEQIVATIAQNPGTGWMKVEVAIKGPGNERIRAVRDGLFAAGRILNVVKQDGIEVALDHCPERRAAHLHVAEDPSIAHLRQSPGAGPAQAAPPLWSEPEEPLRRAPRPIGGAGVAAQVKTDDETDDPEGR